MQLNVLFINGMGGKWTSTSLAAQRQRVLAVFDRTIYSPPPVDYKETGLILRYLEKFKAPTIFSVLSCGCSTLNLIGKETEAAEIIPYGMYCSPSIWCGLGYVPPTVKRATQVTSWGLDFFNPGSRMILQPAKGNNVTVIDKMQTSAAHGFTPTASGVPERLIAEIKRAQETYR